MKVTRRELAQLIKEELDGLLNEVSPQRLAAMQTARNVVVQPGYRPAGDTASWEGYPGTSAEEWDAIPLGVESEILQQSILDPEAAAEAHITDLGAEMSYPDVAAYFADPGRPGRALKEAITKAVKEALAKRKA